jgi:hypothetical protein
MTRACVATISAIWHRVVTGFPAAWMRFLSVLHSVAPSAVLLFEASAAFASPK